MMVSVGFWLLVYSGEELGFVDIVAHGPNAIWLLIDILLTYNPLYFKHVYQSVLFVVVYVLFSVIYDYSLNKSEWSVYGWNNWSENFGEALFMSIGFTFCCSLFYFLHALVKPQLPIIEEI